MWSAILDAMTPEQGRELTRWARESIREALGGPKAKTLRGEWCEMPAATFVTLRDRSGELHGCIGSLEPRRNLAQDVRQNALAAALDDPRAPPLEFAEVDRLVVEVSVLSPLERIAASDEQEALAKIKGLKGGVVLEFRDRRATFLPQMWEQLPDAEDFLWHLKRKAGLAAEFWDRGVKLFHYSVQKFED